MPYFLACGVLLSILCRRKLRALIHISFVRPFWLIGCLVIQLCLSWMAYSGYGKHPILLEITFAGMLLGLFWNRNLAGVPCLLIGAFMNWVALLSHGGLMPVSLRAMQLAGLPVSGSGMETYNARHQWMASGSLNFLGDWIPFLHHVMSLGDIIAGVGIVWFIVGNSAKRGTYEGR